MAQPKKRTSKSRKNIRRKNHKVVALMLKPCKKCGLMVRPHTICKECGNYNN